MNAAIPTFATLLLAQADSDRPAVYFEDQTISYRDFVERAQAVAAYIQKRLDHSKPKHIGVLLENTPDYLLWIAGAAFARAVIVGINPTRRGAELERDLDHTDCQFVVTDRPQAELLPAGAELLCVDDAEYSALIDEHRGTTLNLEPHAADPLLLLFTSGSTSAPKAVVCSTGRLAGAGIRCIDIFGMRPDDVAYCSMPLFHGNALMACWSPTLAVGAPMALRRKFSASGFLDDIRRFDCSFFTYVGRSIAYVLAQPPTDHDRDNRLRLGFGTEASLRDRELFMDRFGCPLLENYGSSESVITLNRTADTPPESLGVAIESPTSDIIVANPATSEECPPATFDQHGALSNGNESIGELVNRAGLGSFEGYYNNAEATQDRLRNGWYWSGDLAYRDADGYIYFAGRSSDWLRVDSENFAAAPVENILQRLDDAVMIAVYPVPDVRTGDQVMAAIEYRDGYHFDAAAFGAFLADQPDLGTKWAPKFVRLASAIPLTANNKVNKQPLRAQAWDCTDPVYWRPDRDLQYRLLTDADRTALAADMAANGVTRTI